MSEVIWKFDIPWSPSRTPKRDGKFEFDMPVGATIIYLAKQRGVPQLWATTLPNTTEYESRRFVIVATGRLVPDNTLYIGSWQMAEGNLVWHLFEFTKLF